MMLHKLAVKLVKLTTAGMAVFLAASGRM